MSNISIDFTAGALQATIQRGTTDNKGNFVPNYPTVQNAVNPDGSFYSVGANGKPDGAWVGSLGSNVSTLVAQLKSQFDQFILASGLVTGTAE